VDKDLGDRVEQGVRDGQVGKESTSAEQKARMVRSEALVQA
jgi:hypothetical protein